MNWPGLVDQLNRRIEQLEAENAELLTENAELNKILEEFRASDLQATPTTTTRR